MVQIVSLDEKEHAVTMLRAMKHEADLCDFRIIAEGNEYPAHKIVLSSGSAYFRAMLRQDTKESRDGEVILKDVDAECVKICIEFLYSGIFDIPEGKIDQLLHVAIMLQLEIVENAISTILSHSLSAENFYKTRNIATMYSLQTVLKSCKVFYEENFMAISLQPGFQNEKKCDIFSIFKSENLKLSVKEKLMVSRKWAGENPAKKENLFELIKLINLEDVSSEYLGDILENDPVIGNDFRLYKLITASCIEKMKAIIRDSYNHRIVLFDYVTYCLRSYDPATGKVTKFHNEEFDHMSEGGPRLMTTAVSMDSYIYVLCCNKSFLRLNFRDKNSEWERMQNTIAKYRFLPVIVSLSGSLFVVGSSIQSDGKITNHVEKFDPTAKYWLKLDHSREVIESPTLATLGNSIFCIGGLDARKAVNSFSRFTPSSSEWVDLEPMKNARYGCSAVAVKQRLFVLGGTRYGEKLTEVECYDVNSKRWTSLTRMINPHDVSVPHHVDGWIFLVGRRETSDKMEKYNIKNDKWHKVEFKDVEKFIIYDAVSILI